ncbi:hypothetical protein BRARA_A01744 [Brassica rapa]|uniref:O-methyltransferase C-terminal domain-containing protein n=1 Tax=Brassica campestris TaxID=3711 RepID=A0A398AQ24_BRACM|nr:hypothetical protein BRARA_A01744 [Brassica rapa]
MQPAGATVLPMVLTSALELDLLEIISKNVALPWGQLSPSDVASYLPTKNPDVPIMLSGSGVERLYGFGPSNYTIVMTKILETCKSFQGFFCLMLVPGGGIGVTFRNPYDCLQAPITFMGILYVPHVIAEAVSYPGIEHIGGNMFLNIPKEDDIFMKLIPSFSCSDHTAGGRKRMEEEFESLARRCDNSSHGPHPSCGCWLSILIIYLRVGFRGFQVICNVFGTYIMEFYKMI